MSFFKIPHIHQFLMTFKLFLFTPKVSPLGIRCHLPRNITANSLSHLRLSLNLGSSLHFPQHHPRSQDCFFLGFEAPLLLETGRKQKGKAKRGYKTNGGFSISKLRT
jgi:hypothetical protein